jgi:hypothetical protein
MLCERLDLHEGERLVLPMLVVRTWLASAQGKIRSRAAVRDGLGQHEESSSAPVMFVLTGK